MEQILHDLVREQNSQQLKTLLSGKIADIDALDKEGRTALHCAVLDQWQDGVCLLLERGANVKARDSEGNTSLHLACSVRHRGIVELLLDFGADVNSNNCKLQTWQLRGRTALHLAVLDQWEDGVCLLLMNWPNVEAKDSEGNTPLYIACSIQHHGIVELLLDFGADVNSRNCTHQLRTPLYVAVGLDNFHLADIMLKKGADINIQDENGDSVLSICCKSNKKQMLQFLLINGSNIESTNHSGMTPLLVSCKVGNVDAVKELLSRRANVHCTDVDKNTALHVASWLESPEIVELLLDAGSDLESRNKHNETPLLYAIKYCHERYDREVLVAPTYGSVISYLIQKGAKVNVCDYDKMMPLFFAIQLRNVNLVRTLLVNGADVNAKNFKKDRPLHFACRYEHDEIASELMVYGAEVNVRNNKKETPLHIASSHSGKKTIIKLLKEGADVNLKDKRRNTPLLLVDMLSQHAASIVTSLLKYGADLQDYNKSMRTLLMSAAHGNNLTIVELLLNTEVDVNAQDVHGDTALHCVDYFGDSLSVIEKLLAKGANVNIVNKDGNTPLVIAVWYGCSKDIVEVFLKHGSNVNHKNMYGQTALHYAYSSCLIVVEILLANGAKVNIADNQGDTPLISAVRRFCDKDVVEVLLKHGTNVNHKNLQGRTALHYESDLGVAKLLLLSGCDVNEVDNEGKSCLHCCLKDYYYSHSKFLPEFFAWGASVLIKDRDGVTPLGYISEKHKPRKAIGESVKRYIVMAKAASLTLEPPLDVNLNFGFDHLSDFQEECLQEVDRMKARRVGGICAFDILSKYRDPTYLSNSELGFFVDSLGQKPKEFPIYESVLIATYRRAKRRWNLMNKVQSFLRLPLTIELIREILSYLEDRRLETLTRQIED